MLVGVFLVLFFIKEDPTSYGQVRDKHQTADRSTIFTATITSLLVILFIQRFTRSVFAPYLPLYLEEISQTSRIASLTGFVNLSVGFATAIAGLTISRLGDVLPKFRLILWMLGLAFVVSMGLVFTNGLMAFVVFYTLLFFVLGGIEPLVTSSTAELTAPENRGLLFGYQGMVGSLGWMVSPMSGAWISVKYGYDAILYMIPLLLTLNGLLAFINRHKHTQQ